jgi:cytochrome P450
MFPKANILKGKEDTLNAKFSNGPNLVFLSGAHWKAQRMIANPAFHRAQPIQLFGKLAQDLFAKMDTMAETVEVTDLMERWTLQAIGKAGFG